MKKEKIKCLFCKSNRTVKRGLRYNSSGRKQTYLCHNCSRKFTPHNRRMRFSEKEIRKAVDLYRSGLSLSDVQLRMKRSGISVSRWTVSLWDKKY